ncbi:hypothetical protein C7G42_29230 [Bradyrhizobium sp. MOS003]|nr:hypothetical protein C7G42_29230 [Bradyrhizobium sp. MOS003]
MKKNEGCRRLTALHFMHGNIVTHCHSAVQTRTTHTERVRALKAVRALRKAETTYGSGRFDTILALVLVAMSFTEE